ncbi:MAG: Gfo/Idh/MocA family oxidoreductase, partial [Candidatus Hydrogenedentes bacterium]|nr:Gfo/Idh/MocA family oxidoreductase [Candidatus Hydrogenedentota bacterium]
MSHLSRRALLASTTTAIASGCATTSTTAADAPRVNTARVVPGKYSPNEKLNIAAVGVGGMGRNNVAACAEENIVALCDVDWGHAGKIADLYPQAKRYTDFRDLFAKEDKNIDAVIIATPDHTHAVIATAAIRLGKHVYCQKPLAHNLHEVRQITEAARSAGVQTQMGNQGHSSEHIRRLYE